MICAPLDPEMYNDIIVVWLVSPALCTVYGVFFRELDALLPYLINPFVNPS